jgi:hypothetical protein
MCEISASSWFYYKEICYDAARSQERKKYIIAVYSDIHTTTQEDF